MGFFNIFSSSLLLFGIVWASEKCKKVGNRKPFPIDANNKYGLWSGLLSPFDLEHGENIFGVTEVM
jgi:hypothetical protein